MRRKKDIENQTEAHPLQENRPIEMRDILKLRSKRIEEISEKIT